MGDRDLRGKPIADRILAQAITDVTDLTKSGWAPKLVSIILTHVRPLSLLEPGDYVVIHDTP